MRITQDRMVNVLGPAPKPEVVWQEDLDYNDDVLREMARLDWDQIGASHLSYYVPDLMCEDVQPDLFRHVFPACLRHWYGTLMRDESCGKFHGALILGRIPEKMLSEPERQSLYDFFADGMLDRIEATSGFGNHPLPDPLGAAARYEGYWILHFNSLGVAAPVIPRIWEDWWSLDSPGKAVCAVVHASGLVYLPEENPIFGLNLTENDGCIPHSSVWRNDNLEFLRSTLSADYVTRKLDQAANALSARPEAELAARVSSDAKTRTDFVGLRVENLITALSLPWRERLDSWKSGGNRGD